MVSYDTNVRITEIKRSIDEVKDCVNRLLDVVKPEVELWDNSDLIRNWKVSERTLATWRQNGLINFIRVNGKIWYTKDARDRFLKDHQIRVQHETTGGNNGK